MSLFGNAGPTSSQNSTSVTTNTTTTDAGHHEQDNSIQSTGPVLNNSNGHLGITTNITNSGEAVFGNQLGHLADVAFGTIGAVARGFTPQAGTDTNAAPTGKVDDRTKLYIGLAVVAVLGVAAFAMLRKKG